MGRRDEGKGWMVGWVDGGEGGVKARMDGGVDTWVSQRVDGWIPPATSQMMDEETMLG